MKPQRIFVSAWCALLATQASQRPLVEGFERDIAASTIPETLHFSISNIVENDLTEFVVDPKKYRIVAIGDLHGSWNEFSEIAQQLSLIDSNENWIAENTIFVQMGDLIHRGRQNVKVVSKLFEYKEAAPRFNSLVALVMGNHDYQQLIENNCSAYEQAGSWYMPDCEQFQNAMLYGGNNGLADKLRTLKLMYSINGYLFIHAGITAQQIENIGRAAGGTDVISINRALTAHFQTVTPLQHGEYHDILMSDPHGAAGGVLWLQWLHHLAALQRFPEHVLQTYYSKMCGTVAAALNMLDAHTMVVGHYCPSSMGQVKGLCPANSDWKLLKFIDVCIYRGYQDALIIADGKVQTLKKTRRPTEIEMDR